MAKQGARGETIYCPVSIKSYEMGHSRRYQVPKIVLTAAPRVNPKPRPGQSMPPRYPDIQGAVSPNHSSQPTFSDQWLGLLHVKYAER